jgi:hypothetical protein
VNDALKKGYFDINSLIEVYFIVIKFNKLFPAVANGRKQYLFFAKKFKSSKKAFERDQKKILRLFPITP